MIKLLRKINNIRYFKKNELKESADVISNPYRGWFSLHIFDLSEEPDFREMEKKLNSFDTLVLILADIGAYRESRLGEKEFKRLENILNFFIKKNKDIILRVAYDHEGKGMEREPYSFRTVLEHAEQIAGFVGDHSEDIFIYQGLLVGSWGEMHSSRFLSEEKLRELCLRFEEKIKNKVYMAVRKPVQWRLLRVKPRPGRGADTEGLGIFNDGMFGSDSDLGTFDPSCKDAEKWCSAWNRSLETEFTGMIGKSVPIGGEALFGEAFQKLHDSQYYIQDLKEQNITYLNRYHDIRLMEYWKSSKYAGKGLFSGKSVFDYIEAHLGYRFVVINAEVLKEKDRTSVSVTIENTGFANLYIDAKLYIEYEGNAGRENAVFTGNLNEITASSKKTYSVSVKAFPGKIYIYAKQDGQEKRICFANESVSSDGKLLLGETDS